MPRRKVLRFLKSRLPDPQALEKYLIHYDAHQLYTHPAQFPFISSRTLFANDQPLELEVGCGSGEYLCDLACKDPEANFLGIDKSHKAAHLAVEMAAEQNLENIKFMAADFRLLYPLLLPGSIRAAYLHFPEPYTKASMHRQRIFNPSFLDHIYTVLQPGGLLSVVSDDEAYFMEMLATAESDQRFARTHNTRYLAGFEAGVKSRFQRIWEGHAIVPHRFILRKL